MGPIAASPLFHTLAAQPAAPSVLPADAPGWLPYAMAAAGVALLSLVMLRRMTKVRRRQRAEARAEANATPRERMEALQHSAQRSNPAASIERLMLEAEELARTTAAQMETRATRLEALIRDADERLARLEAAGLEDRSAAPPRSFKAPTNQGLAAIGFNSPGAPGAPGPANQHHRHTPARPAPEVHTQPEAIRRAMDQAQPAGPRDHLAERVAELAARGMTAVQIAQELGEQTGKVELMLALQKG